MSNSLFASISDKLKQFNLDENELSILLLICLDPYGLPVDSAYSMLANISLVSNLEIQKVISKLIANNLLIIQKNKGIEYYQANRELIGITNDELAFVTDSKHDFRILDNPHSPEAMETLSHTFESDPSKLYVCLSITSPSTFQPFLSSRIKKRLSVVFLYPALKLVDKNKEQHWKGIKNEWMELIKELPYSAKKYIDFRFVRKDYRYLYTTLLSDDVFRFNIRSNMNTSTRKGVILEVNNANSLYKIGEIAYKKIIRNSYSSFYLFPIRFIRQVIQKNKYPFKFLCLGLAVILITGFKTEYLISILFGIITNFISNYLVLEDEK